MPIFTCGFELGDLAAYQTLGWISTGGDHAVVTTAGRVHKTLSGRGGTPSFVVGTATGTDTFTSPTFSTDARWLNFYVDMTGATTSYSAIVMRRTGTNGCTIRFDGASATVQVRRGAPTGAVLATGGINPTAGHWVSVYASLKSTAGEVTVYVDGIQVCTYSGDTTSASDDWEQIQIYNAGITWHYYDDIVITDAVEGQLGEHFLVPMVVGGADTAASASGTPDNTSAATRWNNVKEIPPDEGTSYNEFTATGTDRYTTTNLGYTPESVHSVSVIGQGARDGTITQAQTVCATDSSGGGVTEALGTISGLGGAGVYVGWQDVFPVDPGSTIAIAAVSVVAEGSFSIAGDKTADIVDGSIFEVSGSTGNDGTYTVTSTSYSAPNTIIVPNTTPADGTADGNINYNFTSAALDDLRVGVKFS
jgi:hypothetical protein